MGLRISDLIEELKTHLEISGDLEVWTAVDDEGNYYNQLYKDYSSVLYTPVESVYGTEEIFNSEDIEDDFSNYKKVLVL